MAQSYAELEPNSMIFDDIVALDKEDIYSGLEMAISCCCLLFSDWGYFVEIAENLEILSMFEYAYLYW